MRKRFLVVVVLAAFMALFPAWALAATDGEDSLRIGPLAVEHGSISVGETSEVIATIDTSDPSLPAGLTIEWTVSDPAAASIEAPSDFSDMATVTGLAPAEGVIITASLYDADGQLIDGGSSTTINITGDAAPSAAATPEPESSVRIGPLAVEYGAIEVGETSEVIATIDTSDPSLPAGLTIEWTVSDPAAASIEAPSDFSNTATVTGLAPSEEVVITANLYDAGGGQLDSSSTMIIIETGGAVPVWIWVVIGITAAVIVVLVVVAVKRKK